MICVSIGEKNLEICLAYLEKPEIAEIRLDLTEFSDAETEQVFALKKKLIATCRPGKYSDDQRTHRLKTAIKAGASIVDIEYESPVAYRKELMEYARECHCDVMISYHNFEYTPPLQDLEKIMQDCFDMGANIAKIATMVNMNRDNSKILSLYKAPGRLVAIGMGELGIISRIVAPFLGAEFTYASPDEGEPTAPGQIRFSRLNDFIMKIQEI
ncbi:MAG: type I 3-dehydroquinate dehydratase [Bacteroidales bacterium]|nr:type I 3-dehydroquinate dehydratase [Bacteroidales bacterium]